MIGKIFITRSGYDPQLGKHIKDPYLGPNPTLGACRPDIRKQLAKGDHIFVISGKVPDANQYVMAGFEVETKIDAIQAYRTFPHLRLRRREDGQLTGNIIVDAKGKQHKLDDHNSFQERIKNYIVGTNPILISTPDEIAAGRNQMLEALRDILKRNGRSAFEIVGHWGSKLNEHQISQLREWLLSLKTSTN